MSRGRRRRPAKVEGRSLKPLLRNPAAAKWADVAHTQVVGGRSVRVPGWRYTEWEDGTAGAELYDETRDPGEYVNLAKEPRHAALVARLKAMLPKLPVGKRMVNGQRPE